ncbi:hypothetical protein AB4Z42_17185 [Mycobacterium sp. 2YAF39]|uniref:hypothetical protein n=1 Tax=Mycobacterium sp. 2YAF39 TaxID=3233033 RepID=UPI003F9C060B
MTWKLASLQSDVVCDDPATPLKPGQQLRFVLDIKVDPRAFRFPASESELFAAKWWGVEDAGGEVDFNIVRRDCRTGGLRPSWCRVLTSASTW